jgi:hypothetical protein
MVSCIIWPQNVYREVYIRYFTCFIDGQYEELNNRPLYCHEAVPKPFSNAGN